MEVVFENARVLENFVVSAEEFIEEVNLVFSSEGLSVRHCDPSQIALFDFFLPKSAFKHYQVKEKETLGLDLVLLKQLLKGKSNNELGINWQEGEPKAEFVFSGEIKTIQKIPLIQVSSAELPKPKIDFDGSVTLIGLSLKKALLEAKKVSSHCAFGLGEHFLVSAQSREKGEVKIVFSFKEKNVLDFKVSKACGSMFPLNYLQDLFPNESMSKRQIKINLKTNAPVLVEWLDGKAEYSFWLAPRIETDEGNEDPIKKMIREDFEQAIQKEKTETEPAQLVETQLEKPTEKDWLAKEYEKSGLKTENETSKPETKAKPEIPKSVKLLKSFRKKSSNEKILKLKKPVRVLQPVKLVRAKAKPVKTKLKSLEIRFVLRDPRLIDFVNQDRKCFRNKDEQYSTYVRNEKLFSESEEKEQ